MKKLQLYLMITVVVIFSFGFILLPENQNEFNTEWKKVEKLVEKGLPKSALKIVDSIYMVAKQNNNDPQVLKSLIYRVSLQSRFEENDLVNAINVFEKELENAAVSEKQILQSLLAELYSWYYQQNRWKINDMTTVTGIEDEDIRKWDAVKLNSKIRAYYLASLNEQEQLEDIDIEEFSAIMNVEEKDKEASVLWPTLYDLLGNRAINYFSTSDAGLATIGNDEVINDKYLIPAKDFVQMKFDESNDLIELILYQQLLAFHLNENNTTALVDLDLKRLKYIYNHLSQDEKNRDVYTGILNQLRDNHKDNPVFVEISFELAYLYNQSGYNYKPEAGDKNRWDLNITDSICQEAVEAFPNAIKANACRNLSNDINETKFGLQLNAVELPGKPFLGYLSFKNVTKLYYRIVKLDPDISKEQNRYNKDKSQILKNLENQLVHQWSVDLPDTKDHQSHTTEIRMPELSKGLYMVFSSDSPDFKKTDNLRYNKIWISNLSYLTKGNQKEGSFELYVLDREKGNPVPEVAVTTYRSVYEPRGREYSIKKLNTYQTDKSGYLKLSEQGGDKNISFMFSLQKNDDQLFSEGRNYIRHNRPDDKFRTTTYLFTDRAIYRPGQTVYFKGIVVDKNGNNVKIKPGYQTQLRLMNTSYKEVSSIEKTANEFGSFHGAFIIPQGGLNGRMTIKCESGTVSFLVEEYKRPTFQVLFDTIRDTYKLGDEINVPGNVETYTGNAVPDANIKFRVVQQMMHMPYYRYYMYIPYFSEKEIANGTVTTDKDGKFVIGFQTESNQDSGLGFDPNSLFKVHVDVTDMTGEVQSSETSIAVGRISKLLTISSYENIHKEKTKGIKIIAKNLSGADIELDAIVDVYRLDQPEQLLVERNWNKPDIYLITEEEYKNNFPFHVYKNEDQKSSWKREKIYSSNMIISGEDVLLTEQLKTFNPGEYLITVQDLSDTIIKTERYFTLYSTETKKIPKKEIFWSTITNKTAEPGDIVQIVVGSANKKAKILYELVNGNEVVESYWLTISQRQKVIDIPVSENFRGGFKVNLRSVMYNRLFTNDFNIKVPFTNKKLEIALETYRDFLTPGQKEEWKIKISGPNGSKIAAELLAGMYDASLDHFKSNEWGLNLYQSKRNVSDWGSGLFSVGNSRSLNNNRPDRLEVKNKTYPSVNWFGYQQGYDFGIYETDGFMRKQGITSYGGETMKDDQTNMDDLAVTTQDDDKQPSDNVNVQVEEKEEFQIPLRTNFNETAFFYPQLQTDSSGSVILSFTTPDALTEWKLLMLAHTKDLKTGTFVEHIKAKKDLMVIPNMPRFVRQGDQLVFSAKVINYTDEQQGVDVNLELFDPITMKLIDLIEPENSGNQHPVG